MRVVQCRECVLRKSVGRMQLRREERAEGREGSGSDSDTEDNSGSATVPDEFER